MTQENAFDESTNVGSSIQTDVPGPNALAEGKGETSQGTTGDKTPKIDPTQHEELESLVGKQGQELGEFRKFFADIAPLLDKLDKSPEIVQAIVEGNITADLAKAAIAGKVSIEDAKIVDQAHEEVKKDLGKKDYQGATAEEITKLVEEKTDKIKTDFQKELKKRDDLSSFESSVNDFVARTPDFPNYAAEIDKWIDKHNVDDIIVAYYAVKGELSEKEAKEKAKVDEAEAKKNMALNAGGGSSIATHIKGNDKLIDTLISSKSNPNTF